MPVGREIPIVRQLEYAGEIILGRSIGGEPRTNQIKGKVYLF